MGQYYMPILVREKNIKSFYSHDFDNGLKLMEHSYIQNNFVAAIVHDLKVNGPAKVFWTGDYTDQDDLDEKNIICMRADDLLNIYYEKYHSEDGIKLNCTDAADEKEFHKEFYLINRTKNVAVYVDGRDIEGRLNENYRVHPLPLFTCTCNHSGGSYYSDYGNELIGTWCGDEIEYSDECPDCELIRYEFTEGEYGSYIHDHPDHDPFIIKGKDIITDLENEKYYTRDEAIDAIRGYLKWNIQILRNYICEMNSVNGVFSEMNFRKNDNEEISIIFGNDMLAFADAVKNYDDYCTNDNYIIYDCGSLKSYSDNERIEIEMKNLDNVIEELIDNFNDYSKRIDHCEYYSDIKDIIENTNSDEYE